MKPPRIEPGGMQTIRHLTFYLSPEAGRERRHRNQAIPFDQSSAEISKRLLDGGPWVTVDKLKTPLNRKRTMKDMEQRLKFFRTRCGSRVPLARENSCRRAPGGSMLWAPNGVTMVYCEDCLHYSLGDLEDDAAEAS